MSSSTDSLPPELFGDGEIITFFPTVEFLESQAKYLWNSTETYYIKLSSYKGVKLIGSNPYLLNNTANDLIKNSLSEFYEFGSDDITLEYQQSTASYAVILPEETKIKVKKPATVDSVYIAKGTQPLLGGFINYSSNNEILLAPIKDNIIEITKDFYDTSVNTYHLGLANDVEIVKHSSPSLVNDKNTNFVLFNSTNDFLSKSILTFDSSSSYASYVELNPVDFSFGTLVSRPSVIIDFGTAPVSFNGSQTDLIYDTLFIYKSSVEDVDNKMVCYAAPLDKNYCLFGLESSKAKFDELDMNEIISHDIQTELTWEVIIF